MLNIDELKETVSQSPAMVFDADSLANTLELLATLRAQSGCKVLYSIKALPLFCVLDLVKSYVNGFSVSSLFEARLAHESLGGKGCIHLTSPGIRPHEVAELNQLCSHVSANSIHQFQAFHSLENAKTSLGVRVNPGLSFCNDVRYDPCRPFSKLGIGLASLDSAEFQGKLNGLHFHTIFSCNTYQPLLATIGKLRPLLDSGLLNLDWLNLGGGYLYGNINDSLDFIALVKELNDSYGVEIYIEPGNAIVGNAGYLMATVIDQFSSDGKQVAVLDASVNHLPGVFEYQSPPDLVEHFPRGDNDALLAGSTCLAGDLFGEYSFLEPLKMGDRVVFKNVGAYSLVKAQRFNGYNLPELYLHEAGKFQHIKTYSFEDFRRFWMNDEKLIVS